MSIGGGTIAESEQRKTKKDDFVHLKLPCDGHYTTGAISGKVFAKRAKSSESVPKSSVCPQRTCSRLEYEGLSSILLGLS